ncbi:hypothetical protein [Chlamydia caviae]|uniref:Inclusion membrane protein C n=2 Tax=Chlamydia caviae TaxID=83557 RepID=H2VFU1_CHLCV|nr:hypothetical protein [Chlamydia caviae]AAC46379.1 inclusion membrane protein C [Chlamydia caviae]AAP05234.1 inclusion membrane protein C [Chlamydia caviae GPIC]
MTSVRTDLTPGDTSLQSSLLNPSDLTTQLSNLQTVLAGIQQQHPLNGGWPQHHPTGAADQNYLMRLMQSHMASTVSAVSELRTEVTAIKTKLHGLSTPANVCSGPMALAAFLLAISLVAIIIIVLASLGLAGILPQAAAILVNTANSIWAIVSASIVTVICLISVLCITLIRHHKPLPIETRPTGH